MEQLLVIASKNVIVVIDAMALVIISIGTIEAFYRGVRAMLAASANGHEIRQVWLRYARWLVAGLTFQLAADIIETAIAPSWEDLGQLAAIAVIRTFLDFFLERNLEDVRERQHVNRAIS